MTLTQAITKRMDAMEWYNNMSFQEQQDLKKELGSMVLTGRMIEQAWKEKKPLDAQYQA